MTTIDIESRLYGLPSDQLTSFAWHERSIIVHKNVEKPLIDLLQALMNVGLNCRIVSHWRSYEHQLSIWNGKWSGNKTIFDKQSLPLDISLLDDDDKFHAICAWSALPGTSRHHWGTDFDIFLEEPIINGHNVELCPSEFAVGGVCFELEKWLEENLASFGFFRPYQQDLGGVAPEAWHISYQSIANDSLSQFNPTHLTQQLRKHSPLGLTTIEKHLADYLQQYVYSIP